MRWGPGPVFIYECLAGPRRWQTYALRSFAVAGLLVGMAVACHNALNSMPPVGPWQQYARLGEWYFFAMIGVELALVLLAAPPATAGAICHDRARGTLEHVLATDLSDAEIVLGKLAARMLPVLGLVACSWPVLAISSLLGGIDPMALAWAFAIILATALLGCTLALALSVWARKSFEVVLTVYLFWTAVMLLYPSWAGLSAARIVVAPPGWTLAIDPFYLAFAPYAAPGRVGFRDYLEFFGAALGGSFLWTLLAVWRMRPVAVRGPGGRSRRTGLGWLGRMVRRLPGPSLDGNPVLWREWHRSRTSPWMMVMVVLVGGLTLAGCGIGTFSVWKHGISARIVLRAGIAAGFYGTVLQTLFGLLMLSAIAPLAMSEERQRGSLDLLAVTALSSRSIVLGKWLGTFRLVPFLLIGPGLFALAMATAHRIPWAPPAGMPSNFTQLLSRGERFHGAALVAATVLAHGALIASVGLALACWVRRQGRAIALSVGIFAGLAIGWPILIGSMGGLPGSRMGLASPVFATGELCDALWSGAVHENGKLWWATFWDVVAAALALGLLWLVSRSADRSLGRVPDRPRQTSVLSERASSAARSGQ